MHSENREVLGTAVRSLLAVWALGQYISQRTISMQLLVVIVCDIIQFGLSQIWEWLLSAKFRYQTTCLQNDVQVLLNAVNLKKKILLC